MNVPGHRVGHRSRWWPHLCKFPFIPPRQKAVKPLFFVARAITGTENQIVIPDLNRFCTNFTAVPWPKRVRRTAYLPNIPRTNIGELSNVVKLHDEHALTKQEIDRPEIRQIKRFQLHPRDVQTRARCGIDGNGIQHVYSRGCNFLPDTTKQELTSEDLLPPLFQARVGEQRGSAHFQVYGPGLDKQNVRVRKV